MVCRAVSCGFMWSNDLVGIILMFNYSFVTAHFSSTLQFLLQFDFHDITVSCFSPVLLKDPSQVLKVVSYIKGH